LRERNHGVFESRLRREEKRRRCVERRCAEWLKLSCRYENFQLDTFQIMPNHIHAIVSLIDTDEIDDIVSGAFKDDILGRHFIEGKTGAILNLVDAGNPFNSGEAEALLNLGEAGDLLGFREVGASPANKIPELNNLKKNVLVRLAPTSNNINSNPTSPSSKSLSDIIGSYKSIVANVCLEIHKQKYVGMAHVPLLGKIWKRGFFDNIIRNQHAYKSISRYIRNNPKNWTRDKFFKE